MEGQLPLHGFNCALNLLEIIEFRTKYEKNKKNFNKLVDFTNRDLSLTTSLSEPSLKQYRSIHPKIIREDKIITGDKVIIQSIQTRQKEFFSSSIENIRNDTDKLSTVC